MPVEFRVALVELVALLVVGTALVMETLDCNDGTASARVAVDEKLAVAAVVELMVVVAVAAIGATPAVGGNRDGAEVL